MGAIITKIGLEKIAAATVESPLKFDKFAVGDGGGADIIPNEDMTALKGEKYRDYLNEKYSNNNNVVIECVLRANAPITEGFYVRELGIFDINGNLIVVTDVPLQYRPATEQGNVVTEIMFNINIQIDNAGSVTINVNQSVFATQDALEREKDDRSKGDVQLGQFTVQKEVESVARDDALQANIDNQSTILDVSRWEEVFTYTPLKTAGALYTVELQPRKINTVFVWEDGFWSNGSSWALNARKIDGPFILRVWVSGKALDNAVLSATKPTVQGSFRITDTGDMQNAVFHWSGVYVSPPAAWGNITDGAFLKFFPGVDTVYAWGSLTGRYSGLDGKLTQLGANASARDSLWVLFETHFTGFNF